MDAQATTLQTAENDLKQLMADVTRAMEKAQDAVTRIVPKAATATTGTTLVTRVSIGFAQTGGMGGWVATEPGAKVQMMPNGASPIE